MTKKVLPLFVLITLAACLLSYKVGSAPVALAKARPTMQETTEQAVLQTLPTAPGTWIVSWPFNVGGDPTVTKAAGGAGVKHVAACISVHYTNNSGTNSMVPVVLRDGPSGTGTVLAQWQLGATATRFTGSQIDLCDLNIVGSANTSMSLEFNPGNWGGLGAGSVNLVGYDAQ